MKRYLFWAAVAATFVSCSVKEEVPAEPADGSKVLTIQAARADVDTRTSYAGEKTFSWSVGDKISVLCNDGSSDFLQTFTATTAAATSEFTATVPANVNLGPKSSSGYRLAMFPASDGHQYAASWNIQFHIPAERDFRAASGGHPSADVPMFAWGTADEVYRFSNMTGAAKFTFAGISCSAVKFQFTAARHKLNGLFNLYYAGDGQVHVDDASNIRWNPADAADATEKTVTYYADVDDGKAVFYLPFVAGDIDGPSTLTLTDAATGEVLYSNESVRSIHVNKNQIAVLPTQAVQGAHVDFTSKYGIDWDVQEAAVNTDESHPAIRKMKATADDDYLYLYLEVDPAALTTKDAYDHYIKVYAANESGTDHSWWSDAGHVSKIGSSAWAVVGGKIAFEDFDSALSGCNLLSCADTWYYEVRFSRTHAKTSALLAEPGRVNIGVVLDDTYYIETVPEGQSHYAHLQSDVPCGIIPSSGAAMYPVDLPLKGSSGGVNVDLTFHESTVDVKNPERGLYKMVEYFYHNRDESSTSATKSLTDDYNAEGTLVMTLFYLFDFVDSDHISSSGLQYVRNVLTNVRKEGKKAIVRFAYNNEHPSNYHQEPTKDQILNHLTDLQPVLSDFEDVIYVVQAGFIGTYGEWYYTTNFSRFEGSKEYRDFTVSGNTVTGFENRAAVLDGLLAAVPASRQIELRTPFYKRYYLSPGSISSWTQLTAPGGTDANARLAFHNDAFLAGSDDMGTYHHSDDRPMWKQQSAWLICGGEAPYGTSYSLDYGDTFEEVRTALCDYHYSYLHHDTAYHTGNSGGSRMMKYWHEQGWMPDIKKLLGYRLYLESARISAEGLGSGSVFSVSMTLHNSGAAPVVNERPMKLVLLHNGSATVLEDQVGEIRLVASQASKTFTVTVTLPQDIVSGDKLALWLPDAATGLQSRSEYSIRLANSEVAWSSGYNIFYTF